MAAKKVGDSNYMKTKNTIKSGSFSSKADYFHAEKAKPKKAKIATFDIEVLSSMDADCGSVCCVSWKELNKGTVKQLSLEDFPKSYEKNIFDDRALVTAVVKELSKYDVLIGHNIKPSGNKRWGGFDIKYLNTRIAVNSLDLPPLQGMKVIDTYQDIAKRWMKFRSDRLIELGKSLGAPKEWLESKNDMRFPQDWNAYIVKRPGASKKMLLRNKVDVLLTEWVYNRLQKFFPSHPNFGIINGANKLDYPCPSCGHIDKIHHKDKRYQADTSGRLVAQVAVYQRYICRHKLPSGGICNRVYRGPRIR